MRAKACALSWKSEDRNGRIDRMKAKSRFTVSGQGKTLSFRRNGILKVTAKLCLLSITLLAQLALAPQPFAQDRRISKSGAHSSTSSETFTPADRRLVERAIGATSAERIRDPLGSMSIDEMQARPSLPVRNPDAVAGARRAERLLPTTRTLVVNAIIELDRKSVV